MTRNEQIVEATKRGETSAIIAKTHGLSERRAAMIARQAGIVRHENYTPRSTLRRVRDLRRRGFSVDQICKEVGVSRCRRVVLNIRLVDAVQALRAGRSLSDVQRELRSELRRRLVGFRDQDRDHYDVDLVDALAIGPSHRELRQFGGAE